MNIAKLQSFLNKLSISGDSDMAELVRTTLETAPYVPNAINDNVVLSGTTAATTTSYLAYGVNNITTASPTAYAIRLPYPPQKGKQVIIVNNSTMPVAVYPSVDGGSINGDLNGVGMVPNDGKAYTFYCYENPLPGAWTWTPPAINQYDSGIISIMPAGTGTQVTCVNTNFAVSNSASYTPPIGISSRDPLFGGYTDPTSGNQVVYAKPATKWNSITKIKVYTNAFFSGQPRVDLVAGGGYSLINTTTNQETPYVPTANNIYATSFNVATWQTVPGTPASGAYSPNIGDAGTKFIEIPCSLFCPVPNFTREDPYLPTTKSSTFGTIFLGTEYDSFYNVTYEKWFTQGFALRVQLSANSGTIPLKLRFFIEYN